jgi:hypothetical protein
MRFLMLVKSDANAEAGVMPDQKLLSEMGAYNEELVKAGAMLAGEGLQASSKGARVRIAGKKTTVTDGPFAEGKELVAGYWVIQAKSKAEAVDWAKRVPFQDGEIEVRQLFELEDFPTDPAEKPDGWRDHEEQFREAAPPARKPGTTRFLLMLKADKNTEAGMPPNEKVLAAMGGLIEEMAKAGVLLAGEGLQPTSKGARVQFAKGKRTVVDGPFTEAKELIAGYSLIQVPSKAEAIEWARRGLAIHVEGTGIDQGQSEIRQVFELEDFPASA